MKTKQKTSKKIRKGDQVTVIAGNWSGTTGEVLLRKGDKVLVQGANLCKKHVRRTEQNPKGGVIEFERPLHISNVRLTVDNKPVKVKVRADKNGARELVYTDGKKEVVYRQIKKAR